MALLTRAAAAMRSTLPPAKPRRANSAQAARKIRSRLETSPFLTDRLVEFTNRIVNRGNRGLSNRAMAEGTETTEVRHAEERRLRDDGSGKGLDPGNRSFKGDGGGGRHAQRSRKHPS